MNTDLSNVKQFKENSYTIISRWNIERWFNFLNKNRFNNSQTFISIVFQKAKQRECSFDGTTVAPEYVAQLIS